MMCFCLLSIVFQDVFFYYFSWQPVWLPWWSGQGQKVGIEFLKIINHRYCYYFSPGFAGFTANPETMGKGGGLVGRRVHCRPEMNSGSLCPHALLRGFQFYIGADCRMQVLFTLAQRVWQTAGRSSPKSFKAVGVVPVMLSL